jgi:hypothetical protein
MKIVIVVFTVLLLGTACTKLQNGNKSADADFGSSAIKRDYTGVIAASKPVAESTGPLSGNHHVTLNWKRTQHEASLAQLTEGQKRQLIGWEAPNGEQSNLFLTLMNYLLYSEENGIAPRNGEELLSWNLQRTVHDKVLNLDQLGAEAMPIGFYQAFNPQTGKLYESFDGSVPEPGGVRFHKLVDAADAKRAFAGRPGWERFEIAGIGYEIVVMDATGSSVLDSAVVLQTNVPPPGSSSGSQHVIHRGQEITLPHNDVDHSAEPHTH